MMTDKMEYVSFCKYVDSFTQTERYKVSVNVPINLQQVGLTIEDALESAGRNFIEPINYYKDQVLKEIQILRDRYLHKTADDYTNPVECSHCGTALSPQVKDGLTYMPNYCWYCGRKVSLYKTPMEDIK